MSNAMEAVVWALVTIVIAAVFMGFVLTINQNSLKHGQMRAERFVVCIEAGHDATQCKEAAR